MSMSVVARAAGSRPTRPAVGVWQRKNGPMFNLGPGTRKRATWASVARGLQPEEIYDRIGRKTDGIGITRPHTVTRQSSWSNVKVTQPITRVSSEAHHSTCQRQAGTHMRDARYPEGDACARCL